MSKSIQMSSANQVYELLDASNIGSERWSSYLAKEKSATIFHTEYAWQVFSSSNEHEPFAYFVLKRGVIMAMLTGSIQTIRKGPLSSLTRRAVIMQTPLYNDIESLNVLIRYYCEKVGNKVVFSEIRNHNIDAPCVHAFTDHKFHWEDHLDIILDISRGIKRIVSGDYKPRSFDYSHYTWERMREKYQLLLQRRSQ